MGSANFESNKHSFGINAFHLEWCTKFRKKVLGGSNVRRILSESIKRTAEIHRIKVLALEIGIDPIHLFVSMPASMAVSEALQLFKGRSSREIFIVCPTFRKYCFHSGHFWSRGIFFRSVSNVSSDTVYTYIREHKGRELQNTIASAKKEATQLSLLAFV